MDSKSKHLTFSLPIDARMIVNAEVLSKQQHSSLKARQVYLNVLAVLAVDFYCQCMDITTDVSKSYGLNNIMSTLMDSASLFIPDQGLLECRPILPNQSFLVIPKEVMQDRIGYVGVEINELQRKATILGFIKSADTEKIPVTKLKPLDEFLRYIQLQQPKLININDNIVKLNQWFDGLFNSGWQSEFAFAKKIAPINVTQTLEVTGAKIIHIVNLSDPVLLILHQSQIENEVEIVLRLYPASESIFLLDGIKMTLLDENDNPIPQLEKVSKSSNWLQLRFRGSIGDKFSLKVSLDTEEVIEKFVI
ncbi:MAG: DUF1822 family protein [Calothrix sp. C42_A2020_038]|nr:DUF1822 family protein [Calothrix sp. C42_A2020_038]